TRFSRDWSSDVCSSDLEVEGPLAMGYDVHRAGRQDPRQGDRVVRGATVLRAVDLIAGEVDRHRAVVVELERLVVAGPLDVLADEIGRASCREGVWTAMS